MNVEMSPFDYTDDDFATIMGLDKYDSEIIDEIRSSVFEIARRCGVTPSEFRRQIERDENITRFARPDVIKKVVYIRQILLHATHGQDVKITVNLNSEICHAATVSVIGRRVELLNLLNDKKINICSLVDGMTVEPSDNNNVLLYFYIMSATTVIGDV